MKNAAFIFLVIFFLGCFEKDIERKTFNKNGLKDDVKILKGIVADMHAGAYAYNTPQELNATFDSVSNSIIDKLSVRDFYKKIDFLIDKLRCIHTAAYLPTDFYDTVSKKDQFFPVPVVLLNDKLYSNTITNYIPLGAEILYINDYSANYIINQLKKYEHTDGYSNVARNNAIDSYFAYNFYLEYGGFKKFKIQYMADSSETSITEYLNADNLERINTSDIYTAYSAIPKEVNYDMQMLNKGKTALFYIRTFHLSSNNEKNAFYHFLENSFALIKRDDTKNVIIDCRENGGGFYDMTFSFLSYLVNETLP